MKRLEYIFIMFAAILLTTSCSKDDLLPDGSTDAPVTGQTQTYTFTVSPDITMPDITMEGDARTRSEGTQEEMPTRCFMQIFGNNVNLDVQPSESIENGSFTFSVALPSNTDYTFLFWADNNSGDTPADLRAIQYTPGTVAFAANVQGTLETVDKTVEELVNTLKNDKSVYVKGVLFGATNSNLFHIFRERTYASGYRSTQSPVLSFSIDKNGEVVKLSTNDIQDIFATKYDYEIQKDGKVLLRNYPPKVVEKLDEEQTAALFGEVQNLYNTYQKQPKKYY